VKPVAAGKFTVIETVPPEKTLPPRKAGEAVSGFARLTADEWPSASDSVIAISTAKSIEVYRIPADRSGVLRFDAGRSVTGPVRFLALGSSGEWVKVAMPVRPNGTVGWVRAADVQLQRSTTRITLELLTNTLRLYEGDKLTIETKVGAGTGGTPTPTGLFFVKEHVPQANPHGALGPIALGLSAFSTVLQTFAGGTGNVAIHGTNAPGKLGGDVSHGCIRVANAVILRLADLAAIGTPVEIAEKFTDLPSTRRTSAWVDELAALRRAISPATGAVAAGSTVSTVIPGEPTPTVPPTAATTTPVATSTTVGAASVPGD
jgi:hypothetical protein